MSESLLLEVRPMMRRLSDESWGKGSESKYTDPKTRMNSAGAQGRRRTKRSWHT